MLSETQDSCWICESSGLTQVREGVDPRELGSEQFKITDSHYGVTGDIYRCPSCGFCQCASMTDVLEFYENMSDEDYEGTRQPRAIQQRRIIKRARKYVSAKRLLDVGAGSGILVEEAIKLGMDACGIEPSVALQAHAKSLGIPVYHGVLPHEEITGEFEIVTLVDVLEHVSNPVDLLKEVNAMLTPDGIAIVETPDVGSVVAKILGRKWWHYRIAHIGYFSLKTLKLALGKAGLELIKVSRPTWYFPVSYILERIQVYLPKAWRRTVPKKYDNFFIPLNFRDSLMAVCKKSPPTTANS